MNSSKKSSRRDFLRSASAALGWGVWAATAPGQAFAQNPPTRPPAVKPVVGSQLYAWGQYDERAGKNLNAHLDEVLAAIRDCGYEYAEGWLDAAQPENNARFAEQLRAKGLKPVSLYTGGRLHEQGAAEATVQRLLAAAGVCQKAGFQVLNCNPDPIGREKTDAELAVQAAALTRLGTGLNQLGLRLGVHNHTPEMKNHAREFHFNFDHTEPAIVGFCFDVHWVDRGGIAPLTALAEYGNRVVSWHLRQSRNGIWWEDLDTGDIDYSVV
ncbi:MAG: TIM barrel protein, partial [Verrucomicrobia bacterium]|nr:TIM barrel protein [Verrucomicrobiota bacterium]